MRRLCVRPPSGSRSIALAAGSIAALLLLSSCSGPPDDAPAPTPSSTTSTSSDDSTAPTGNRQLPADQWPDACALLTAEEVGRLTGASLSAGQPGPAPVRDDGSEGVTPGSCTWAGEAGPAGELRIIDVLYPVNEFFASIRIVSPGAVDVEGVATAAFITQRPDGASTFFVCQGHTVFEIAAPPGVEVEQAVFADLGVAAAQRVEGPAAEIS